MSILSEVLVDLAEVLPEVLSVGKAVYEKIESEPSIEAQVADALAGLAAVLHDILAVL